MLISIYRINRYIMECKARNDAYSVGHDRRINRYIMECKVALANIVDASPPVN